MIDQNKIILMSKAAIHEKNLTRKDREMTSYYPEDYIYVKNFKTRLIVLVIIGMAIAAQLLYKIEKGLNIPITIRGWIIEYIIPYGILVLTILIIYSIFSTLVYRKEYKKAQKKLGEYEKAIEKLNRYEEKIKGEEYDSR